MNELKGTLMIGPGIRSSALPSLTLTGERPSRKTGAHYFYCHRQSKLNKKERKQRVNIRLIGDSTQLTPRDRRGQKLGSPGGRISDTSWAEVSVFEDNCLRQSRAALGRRLEKRIAMNFERRATFHFIMTSLPDGWATGLYCGSLRRDNTHLSLDHLGHWHSTAGTVRFHQVDTKTWQNSAVKNK